jgi:hypothetical protein
MECTIDCIIVIGEEMNRIDAVQPKTIGDLTMELGKLQHIGQAITANTDRFRDEFITQQGKNIDRDPVILGIHRANIANSLQGEILQSLIGYVTELSRLLMTNNNEQPVKVNA